MQQQQQDLKAAALAGDEQPGAPNADQIDIVTRVAEKILCSHCQRTATNGIKCKGICVADSDY